jgi:hypothetical protein
LSAALLALSPALAHAEPPRLVPDGQFESDAALGVAVDNSASEADASRGDVYVAGFIGSTKTGEFIPGRVNKFDGSGNLLSPPSPIGNALGYSGAAVNSLNGDVYALDTIFSEIDTYDPATGELLGPPFPVPPSHNFLNPFAGNPTIVGIASDSAGNVYVPVVPENEVLEYDPAACQAAPPPCVPLKTFKGGSSAGALKGPTGVAVDAAGNLWVADTGNNRIEEISPTDTPIRGIASEGVGSVALDAHGDVFAIVNNSADFCGRIKPPCSHLVEYSPAGAQLVDLGAGMIGENQVKPSESESELLKDPVPDMVAVGESSGRVYVTEAVSSPPAGGSRGRVLKFRPPVVPSLDGETAVDVGVSEAKLGAVVSPGGIKATYRFEYGTTMAYGSSVPFPEGDTGAGFTSRTVWAGASGLLPGTTYHYRVVVTGALGAPLVGKDQTFTTQPAAQAACPNEKFRTGFSASLPDCRAYELVTPPNKDSAQPDKNEGGNEGRLFLYRILEENLAAVDGNRLSFWAEDVLPGSPSAGQSYVATRGAVGWTAQSMFPPTNFYAYKCPFELKAKSYSEDLSKAIILVESGKQEQGGHCGVEPELVAGEPRGSENLFVRDNAIGAYQLVNVTPPGVPPATPQLLSASRDFSRIVFAEEAKLTPDAPEGVSNVYEWTAGNVRLVTVLANGTPVAGAFAGISADGSRVFFTASGGLYARVNGTETVQLDASQAGGGGGGGSFLKASHDGSVVFFADGASAGLTSDTVPGSGTNLYRYDSHAPGGKRLTDLTPVANAVAPVLSGMSKDGSVVFFTDDDSAALTPDTKPGSGTNLYRYEAAAPAGLGLTDLTPISEAKVQSVLGVGEDKGEVSVYFTAAGVLTSQANQHGEMPQPGQGNMYLSRGAGSAFIATAAGSFRVSANGGFLLFESSRSLTGYENINPSTGKPAAELYLYDAANNSLACASCNPSGEPPTAAGPDSEGGAIEEASGNRAAPRQLSENGQVFFDSSEGLLPADTNGNGSCSTASGFPACTDVYEFEAQGVGSCSEPAGCLYLISTGTGSLETFFIDASPSGNDVFIREFQKLVPRDTQDGAPSLYDVRMNGGFSETSPALPCDTADACRTAPAPQPSIFGAPASQTFSGAGNLVPPVKIPVKHCRKGFVEKKGKCVKRKARKRVRGKSAHTHPGTGR